MKIFILIHTFSTFVAKNTVPIWIPFEGGVGKHLEPNNLKQVNFLWNSFITQRRISPHNNIYKLVGDMTLPPKKQLEMVYKNLESHSIE